jgi:hypothetical protein
MVFQRHQKYLQLGQDSLGTRILDASLLVVDGGVRNLPMVDDYGVAHRSLTLNPTKFLGKLGVDVGHEQLRPNQLMVQMPTLRQDFKRS